MVLQSVGAALAEIGAGLEFAVFAVIVEAVGERELVAVWGNFLAYIPFEACS